jgi:gliding motility-associated-like protein
MNRRYCVLFLLLTIPFIGTSQSTQDECPPNIGFEMGNFTNWDCFSGKVAADGMINVQNSGATSGRHTMLKNVPPLSKDFYGGFSTTCPNGSGYSIQLGNSNTGADAERVSYTFKIPDNENDFVILYNYAVVFQNPNHAEFEQPKFASAAYDVTTGGYVSCASFEFVASSNLPGFSKSAQGADVFYKPWAPVTIKLYGLAGHTIRLEFTTNDCTKGGHFGYAYVDVNENCGAFIGGNVYCNGAKDIMLNAPAGFMEYHWFDGSFSSMLGTQNTLPINPPPPPNTTYALEIVPFPGLGCLDTLYTKVIHSDSAFNLKLIDSVSGCPSTGVDLTTADVTAGSTPGLRFSYFMDPKQNEFVPVPKYVDKSGTYYIKAVNNAGCSEIQPITVALRPVPTLMITNPLPQCYPGTVDITSPTITSGSEKSMKFQYWYDADTTKPLLYPKQIGTDGTYYIKGINLGGCSNVQPVKVTIADFSTASPTECETVDLTGNNILFDVTDKFSFSFWTDAQAKQPLTNANAIKSSGTYYVKGSLASGGCDIIKPIKTTVLPMPVVTFTPPPVIVYPETFNLTSYLNGQPGLTYTFWKNVQATKPLLNPTRVDSSGTYYIIVKNSVGCAVDFTVKLQIDPPALPEVQAPNIFTPNKDGIHDKFVINIDGVVEIKQLEIFNRLSQRVFYTKDLRNFWDGNLAGKSLPEGTYYWVIEFTDIFRKEKKTKSGFITIIR